MTNLKMKMGKSCRGKVELVKEVRKDDVGGRRRRTRRGGRRRTMA